jgi:TRAP-type mannitol/chloroaromatic compound transport system permease large subunit
MDFLIDNLALFMVLALALLLFSGYPVALVLIGVALGFGLIGCALGQFPLVASSTFRCASTRHSART